MGSPSRNVQYHPPRLSEDRLNLPQPHSPSLPTHCTAPGNRECARQPGDPGPRPTGVWTGSGGSNSPEETAGWRDSRVPESWTVEIAFGNDRIEISYPSLGCSGELEPRNESARWLEYTQDLMCTDPRYRTPFSRGGYLVLQRTADDMLWFEWSRGGRALATASLRPSSP